MMIKSAHIYFGDNLFNKLDSFADHNLVSSINSQNHRIICDPTKCGDDDLYLGWSFIVSRTGNTYVHVGFPNPRYKSLRVFSDCHNSDLNIVCGANEVFATSKDGKLYHYFTENSSEMSCTVMDCKKKIRHLVTGDSQCLILFDDGSVSNLNLKEESFVPLPIQSCITEVACGKEHCLILSESGQVFSCGSGSRGQLGHGTIENQEEPLMLEALDGIRIKAIACGGWHSAAVSDAGDLYMWGWNESGQLGLPCAELHKDSPLSEVETVCCLPKIVDLEEEKQISSVSCGTRHTAVMTEDSGIWTWGWNEYNQLGHNKHPLCDKPHKISLPCNFIPKNVKCAFWNTLVSGTITVPYSN